MKIHFYLGHISPLARTAFEDLTKRYGQSDIAPCDVIVALGGDGTMLEVFKKTLHTYNKPVYGLNYGSFGFLMNQPPKSFERFADVLATAEKTTFYPLKVTAEDENGKSLSDSAINDIVFSHTHARQTIDLKVEIDGHVLSNTLRGDGLILSTPLGSTGYNASAFGPLPPFGENETIVTPLNAMPLYKGYFAPFRTTPSFFDIEVLTPDHRPVSLTADNRCLTEHCSVASISQDKSVQGVLLHASASPFRMKYEQAVATIKEKRRSLLGSHPA